MHTVFTLAGKGTFSSIAIAAALTTANPVLAQSWPTKPVRIVAATAAGSAPDTAARAIADQLSAAWNQTVIVDNKPGAGCSIGMDHARAAPPDGYTLILAHAACVVVFPMTFKTVKYDIERDFVALNIVGVTPMMIVANTNAPARNLAELIAQGKAAPDKVSIGNPTRTSIPHLAAELIGQQSGTRLFQVSFSTPSQAITATVGGDVMYGIDGVAAMLPLVKAGRLKPIAVTADKVLPGLEAYPLAKDTLPGLEVFGWFGLLAPKGTPPAVLSKINEDTNKALLQPDVIARFAGFGTYPRPGTQQEAAAFVKKEQAVWAKVINTAGIQPE